MYIHYLFQERLYWISDVKPPTNVSNSFYFNIDEVQFFLQVGLIIWAVLYGFRAVEFGQDVEVRFRAVETDFASKL